MEVSSSNTVGQLDIGRCERQISRLHHCQRPRRSVSAQYCFSEKEHAEIARSGDSKPRPEIGPSHSAQTCIVSGKRRGQARSGQASRSRGTERTDSQERGSPAQEPARQGREVNRGTVNRRGAFRRLFFLHRCQLSATPLTIPFGGIIGRAAFRTFERLVLLRSLIVRSPALGHRWWCRNGSRRLRWSARPTGAQHRKLVER